MIVFETVLGLLLGATILSVIARSANIPYPTLLAIGGAVVAFIPGSPRLDLPPELILALFVAPILLDAAYDTSLRDLRQNWQPISSLVFIAVGLTTAAVAVTARLFFPDLPWAAAIALGAIASPPDAVAALAVLKQVDPPHRIRTILEGESLLNDASALLIYKLAVGAVLAGSFSVGGAIPTLALVFLGSALFGWALAWPVGWLVAKIEDAPSSVIVQFVCTFGMWLVAERLGLSAVVTIVVFALTAARLRKFVMPARLRVPSFAIWETVTFVLNVLAFTLIGLQLRPIVERLSSAELRFYIGAALAILVVVLVVRLTWTMFGALAGRVSGGDQGDGRQVGVKGALAIGWSGMRGIVTLAAALALPGTFPNRDFVQFCAFVVVLGTLLFQGLTLGPLVRWLRLPVDDTVQEELGTARAAALKATLEALESDHSAAAERLRTQYREALSKAKAGVDPHETSDYVVRLRVLPAARQAIDRLRRDGQIGDEAYRQIEEELDWLELSSSPPSASQA